MTLRMSIPIRPSGRALAAAALLGLLSGCSNEPAKPREVTFELTGNDQMKFSQERFEVDAPAKLTIRLKNVGTMLKQTMGHNLVLLKKGVDVLEFSADCVSAGPNADNDYLPEKVRGQALAWTKVLGPNEQDSLVVDLNEPGSYAYVCTFPGHFATMRGVIQVK
jgi:azurin